MLVIAVEYTNFSLNLILNNSFYTNVTINSNMNAINFIFFSHLKTTRKN